ncbi:hypothetical protein FB451DRAFT_982348, partial [Mycena latifolia]
EALPLFIRALRANRRRVIGRYPYSSKLWRASYRLPSLLARIFPIRRDDTSAACFFGIYEFAVIEDNIRFRNEIEYI